MFPVRIVPNVLNNPPKKKETKSVGISSSPAPIQTYVLMSRPVPSKDRSNRRQSLDSSNIGDVTLSESFSSEVVFHKDANSTNSSDEIDKQVDKLRRSSLGSNSRRRVIFPTVAASNYTRLNTFTNLSIASKQEEEPLKSDLPRTILIQHNHCTCPTSPLRVSQTISSSDTTDIDASLEPCVEDKDEDVSRQQALQNTKEGIDSILEHDSGEEKITSTLERKSDEVNGEEKLMVVAGTNSSSKCTPTDYPNQISPSAKEASAEISIPSMQKPTSTPISLRRPSILKNSRSTSEQSLTASNDKQETTKSFQESRNRTPMCKTHSDSCIVHMRQSTPVLTGDSFSCSALTSDCSQCTKDSLDKNVASSSGTANWNDNRVNRSPTNAFTRHISHEEMRSKRRIRFDPRVWVHEFNRPDTEKIWFTEKELNGFKQEAVARVRSWHLKHSSNTMISSGTGRIISTGSSTGGFAGKRCNRSAMRALFSSPALSSEFEEEDYDQPQQGSVNLSKPQHTIDIIKSAIKEQFKSILLVDPHDIILRLLTKSILIMLPHITIITAHTAEEAQAQINLMKKKDEKRSHGFDIIIIEERLHIQHRSRMMLGQTQQDKDKRNSSGSWLIQMIDKDIKSTLNGNSVETPLETPCFPLLIGISASLQQDMPLFDRSGADLVWGKPPPAMDNTLACELLQIVAQKRQRTDILQRLNHRKSN